MEQLANFYGALPRKKEILQAKAEMKNNSTPISRYYDKYFGEKPSAMPILHLFAVLVAVS